jgi:hypothetical protein
MTLRRAYRWSIATLGPGAVLVLTGVLILMALNRALDYALGESSGAAQLSVVEDAFPLRVWAAGLAVAGLTLAAGVALRVHALVWAGHGMLAIIYAMLCAGVLFSVIGDPHHEGFRLVTLLLLPTVLHCLLCIHTGRTPMR